MGGTAIWRASDEIITKGAAIAADALEPAEADIRFEDGRFVVSGTDRAIEPARGRRRSDATRASRSTPMTSGSAST